MGYDLDETELSKLNYEFTLNLFMSGYSLPQKR